MMKKTAAILLSVLLLVVNMSLTFSTHYCGGEAVETSVALGKSTVGCGMEMSEVNTCDNENGIATIDKVDCCHNTHHTISLEEDYVQNSFTAPVLLIAEVWPIPALIQLPTFQLKQGCFVAYSPPLVRQNRQVLYQVFRL